MSHSILDANEYSPYYLPYIQKAGSASLLENLKSNLISVADFYSSIPNDKLEYRYAEGKWTPKEILLHLIDTERIFSYRALRIARQDTTMLPGFEQDDYVVSSQANKRSIESLIEEYKAVRQSTLSLFKSFDDVALKSIGNASNSDSSVRAIGYIITGHENHHNHTIKVRYL